MIAHEEKENAEQLLERGGVKPTANRLLVVRELLKSSAPMSLIEIETALETLERSSILRVLHVLLKSDIIHSFEDGRGISKYEICHGESHCSMADMHAHFYCERCGKTFCFEDLPAPALPIPPEFEIRTVNYMLKGRCPSCKTT